MTLPDQSLWWLNRSTGLVLLVLFTLVVILGIFSTQRAAGRRIPTFVPNQLHRTISLFAVALLIAHIVTAVLDDYVDIDWVDAVIPFASPYRPLWLGLGTVAVDLTIAVLVTSALKSRLSERNWHMVHLFSYAAWLVAVLHGLGTGTDSRNVAALAVYGICVIAVAASLAARLMWTQDISLPVLIVSLILTAVVPIAIAVWAFSGPLAPGWAVKAGTPSSTSETGQ